MVIEELDARGDCEWEAYIEGHPRSTCYHLLAWRQVARQAYRLRAPFLVARENAGAPIQGALPLFVVPGPIEGHLTNGLFGAYGGLLADGTSAREALVRAAQDILAARRLKYLVLKWPADERPPHGFDALGAWVVAVLPLTSNPWAIWAGFRDKIRNCVRKAIRSGLEVREGRSQLEPFYSVLSENMHRKGAPIYGLTFMRELMCQMGGKAEVLAVWRGGEVVAGALLLKHRRTTYVPFASSRPWALALCPNNLLYWEIIRRSCLRGLAEVDFGSSPRGSGSLAFKAGWGARIAPLRCWIHSATGKAPRLSPDEPLVSFGVRQWRRLPRALADVMGPVICRRWLA
jgi:FemAB-related protein (PEP-CTERM system-associated)